MITALIVGNILFSWGLYQFLWCYVIKPEVPLLVGLRNWLNEPY